MPQETEVQRSQAAPADVRELSESTSPAGPHAPRESSPGSTVASPIDDDRPKQLEEAKPVDEYNHFRGNSIREGLFILVVGLSQFVLAGSLGTTTLPIYLVARGLGVEDDPAELAWFLASFALTAGTFVLAFGRLGSMIGHKQVFIAGWLWCGVWNLGSAWSTNAILFDFTRGMAGVGVAALLPNGSALLGLAFAPNSHKKNLAFAIMGLLAPSGYNVGGLIGALSGQESIGNDWRGGFWFWAAFCSLLGCLSFFAIPPSLAEPSWENADEAKSSTWKRLQSFDFLGTLSGVGFLVLFSVAWNEGGGRGWDTPAAIALLVISTCVFLPAFIWAEKTARFPILPLEIVVHPDLAPTLVALACGWASFGIYLFYTTLMLLRILGSSPALATAQLVPLVPVGVLVALSLPYLIPRISITILFAASLIAFTLGCVLSALTTHDDIYWRHLFPGAVLVPLGPDISFAASALLCSNALPAHLQGVAGSLVTTITGVSMSIGLGAAATAETNTNRGGADELRGYKAALWTGVGLGAAGALIVLAFVKDSRFDKKAAARTAKKCGKVEEERIAKQADKSNA